jgi:major membrane immunogen (membrane-anchored lipoprotein)
MLLRKTVTTLALAAVLAVPSANAWAALAKSSAKNKVTVAWYTGTKAPCGPNNKWGDLQIKIKVQKTTTTVGKKQKVKIKILAVEFPVKSDHTFKTKYITSQALPILTEDLLALQGPNVESISGATDTWVSFKKTLNAALLQAKKPT